MRDPAPGDRVRIRPDAEHTFDAFRGQMGEVTASRTIGGRLWVRLRVKDAVPRTTWLPAARVEPLVVEATS